MPARGVEESSLAERAVEAALAIADESGWEAVRLTEVARRTGLPPEEVAGRFRDVEALADAWFRAARLEMMALPADMLEGRPADERIATALERWLDTLAPHRAVAGQVVRHRLYPSHPHHWVPMVFDLSRLVHDLLDVARVSGSGRLRQAQEVGLTLIVLATFRDWLRDPSPGQERSKARLRRRLTQCGRLASRMARARPEG